MSTAISPFEPNALTASKTSWWKLPSPPATEIATETAAPWFVSPLAAKSIGHPSIISLPRAAWKADWQEDPDFLLERLHSPELSDRRKAAVLCEMVGFSDDQVRLLLDGLRDFICGQRFSRDESTLTAVSASIRKFAMYMRKNDQTTFADWFYPSGIQALPNSIELELAKSLYARFAYAESKLEFCEELVKAVAQLATDYMSSRRLILQENYAAIALNAAVSTVLLSSGSDQLFSDAVRSQLEALNLDWFTEMFELRLAEASEAISDA